MQQAQVRVTEQTALATSRPRRGTVVMGRGVLVEQMRIARKANRHHSADVASASAAGGVAIVAGVGSRLIPASHIGLGSLLLAAALVSICVCALKLMQIVRRI